jgi:hypothetical protein
LIIIPRNVSLSNIEEILLKITNSSSNKLNIRIPAQPIKFAGGGLGVEIALTQLLITWARINQKEESEFHSYVPENNGDQILSHYCTTIYGICALYMAPKITDEKHKVIDRYQALMPAKDLIKAMDESDYERISKRRKYKKDEKGGTTNIFLLSILGASRQYIQSIYTKKTHEGNQIVRDKEEMSAEFNRIVRIIEKNSPSNIITEMISSSTISKVGLILNELIKNTEEHARKDYLGNLYDRAISGVKFGYSSYEEKQIRNIVKNYWKDYYLDYIIEKCKKIRQEKINVFEISVFDSGPGFSRRWTKKDFSELSLQDEKKSVQCCLEKCGSTKSGSGVGEGLYNVLLAINELDGFISIRTGRTLINRGYCHDDRDLCEMDSNEEYLAPVEGTALTICIPF